MSENILYFTVEMIENRTALSQQLVSADPCYGSVQNGGHQVTVEEGQTKGGHLRI